MRKAFVGSSTPIGYYFSDGLRYRKAKPNPILDSPMGLFLFYDEIWFINRRTCPLNCQNLPYVKFLDEEFELKDLDLEQFRLDNIDYDKYMQREILDVGMKKLVDSLSINIDSSLKRLKTDLVGRKFNLGNIRVKPDITIRNLIMDDYIANKFGFDLITNSLSSAWASVTNIDAKGELKNNLTQLLLCENIPNFQLRGGPYHKLVDDLRSERLLKNYRSKIDQVIGSNSKDELIKLKGELEKSMEKYLYELILSHLDSSQIFYSVSSAIIGQVPIIGNIYGGLEGGLNVYNNIKDRKEAGWMGFLAKARLKLDKKGRN